MRHANPALGLAIFCSLSVMDAAACRASAFADAVVAFSPAVVNGDPGAAYLEPGNALGAPDYAGANTCASSDGCSFVSLGSGGSITLRFVDNALTGSGNEAADLWIYEVGPDVEDTFVEISRDGTEWFDVGKVFGSTSSIDIDAFGFGIADRFSYVRLTDDAGEGGQSGSTVGADLDAVEALSSVAVGLEAVSWGTLRASY